VLLAPRPMVGAALVLAVAVLQSAQARTPAWEWGAPSYQRRAAAFTLGLEKSVRAGHPTLPPHTRNYLEFVPQGFGAGEKWFEPVVRVWYGDTTLTVERFSGYRLRSPGEAHAPDLFFGFAPPATWNEIRTGPEDEAAALRTNPYWPEDHRQLALALGRGGDWRAAAIEIEKLARAYPADPQYPKNLVLCLRRSGDEAAAERWQRRADSLVSVLEQAGIRPR